MLMHLCSGVLAQPPLQNSEHGAAKQGGCTPFQVLRHPQVLSVQGGTFDWHLSVEVFPPFFSISSISVLIFLPWRLGLQRGAIERFQATGLDPNKVLLPELLQKGGYDTHLVNQLCLFNMF